MSLRRAAIVAILALAWCGQARAQSGNNVLIVSNALSKNSDEIADYYARKRIIPGDQILRLPLPADEEIARPDFETKIEGPISDWLAAHAAQDRILYIVLTKDVPLRVTGTSGDRGTVASVDSELTLLYRKLYRGPLPAGGKIPNPYYAGETPLADLKRFSHRSYDIYLVTRLDGFTVEDVKALIDRGAAPVAQGVIVLDGKLELTESVGNKWLNAAAERLKKLPGWSDRVVLDTGQATLKNQANVIGFYTWGSNAVAASDRHYGHHFLPGAVAGEYVSTDARTFKEPPADWVINETKHIFGGSHQSLIGDLIRDGVTGVAGHVAEPYLNGTIRPDLLFPAYVSGFNLAESFYQGMPFLSWQTVVIGDPLCAPFSGRAALTDLNPPTDPVTELPALLSERRIALITSAGAKPDVAKLIARSEARMSRKDRPGAIQALEQATAQDEAFPGAQLALAGLYEQQQNWDDAIDRYQKVVAKTPTNPVALNNLAFLLATRKNDPTTALPLATRAYNLSVQDPSVGDTLAWIYHLLGKSDLARDIIDVAARRRTDSPEIQLHAAVIFYENGELPTARQRLDAAIKLDPSLADRDDVKALRLKVQPAK